MDNATNLELNLDKPIENHVFRVRFTREEVEAIRNVCFSMYTAFADSQLLLESQNLGSMCEDFLRMSSAQTTTMTMLYKSLDALCGLMEHVALVNRKEGRTFLLAENIVHTSRAILDRARQDAVPPS